MSLEAKTHLDPRADIIGVTGCCCRSCELARKREYRKALLSSYDSDLMHIAARADDDSLEHQAAVEALHEQLYTDDDIADEVDRIRELEALRRRAEREEFARWGDHDQWTKDREVA